MVETGEREPFLKCGDTWFLFFSEKAFHRQEMDDRRSPVSLHVHVPGMEVEKTIEKQKQCLLALYRKY